MKKVLVAALAVVVLVLASYGAYGAYLTGRDVYSDLVFLRQAHINALVAQRQAEQAAQAKSAETDKK